LELSDDHEKFSGCDIYIDRLSESVACQTFELTLRYCLYPHIDKLWKSYIAVDITCKLLKNVAGKKV
jgi:hypothetical protein